MRLLRKLASGFVQSAGRFSPPRLVMKLTPGELYFIGEDDPIDGTRTSFVKVGIVRESESRTAEKRLNEHQTGNPRQLRLLHAEEAPAVERIETLLQAEFAPCRIGGEWFYLPGAELDGAVERADAHMDEARTILPALSAAEDLKTTQSNGQSLTPDSTTVDRHRRLLDVRKQQDEAKRLKAQLTKALLEEASSADGDSPYVRTEIRAPRATFDSDAFTLAHPDLARRYTEDKHTVRKRFGLTGLQDHESDIRNDNPALFAHRTAVVESLEIGNTASEFHRLYLQLLALRGLLDWEQELLEAALQAACMEYEEVAGVCTWKRESVTKQALNVPALKADLPDLHEEFSNTTSASSAVVIAKDLGYRFS